MNVWVDAPVIDGDRVHFSWRQSEPNPFQRANEFYFRYVDIELDAFSPQLFWEMFLALQLKVFARYESPVAIELPYAIGAKSAAFWQAFHDGEHIEIGPLTDIESYEPLIVPSDQPAKQAAVFYGGGIDSVLATGWLTELLGDDNVVLIQYIAPFNPAHGKMAFHERRQRTLMLDPIQRLRQVSAQRVFSDFLSNYTKEGLEKPPHRELYTAGALPALLWHGASTSTLGDVRTDFAIIVDQDGTRDYHFAESRPERLDAQSRHYQRVLGFNHRLGDLNFPFSVSQNHHLLIARYPELLPAAVSCMSGTSKERFCHRCYKCFKSMLFGLSAGYMYPEMNYDRMLSENQWVLRLVAYADSGVELNFHGNAIWTEGLTETANAYQSMCHALATIDPEMIIDTIGLAALANLYTMMALFGNTRFPNQEVVAQEILDFVGGDLIHEVGRLAAEHYPMVDQLPAPWLWGDRESIIDFQTRVATKMDDLPHLRD
ncbi:hypothetical protein BH09CHL1_BH09CHL1_06130 [soil metagenome]